jgi:hypothetical protein
MKDEEGMRADLENLRIDRQEIDRIIDLDLISNLAIDLYRAVVIRDYRHIFSVGLTAVAIFVLSFILIIPLSSIVLKRAGDLVDNTTGFTKLLFIVIGITLLLLFITNFYLWKKSIKLKSLAILIDKLDKYNQLIEKLIVIDKIQSLQKSDRQENYQNNCHSIVEALTITKESLINALRIEKLIRHHQNLTSNRYELLTELENNLVALMSFEPDVQINEYENILNEVLQLGLGIHKEMRKLSNK